MQTDRSRIGLPLAVMTVMVAAGIAIAWPGGWTASVLGAGTVGLDGPSEETQGMKAIERPNLYIIASDQIDVLASRAKKSDASLALRGMTPAPETFNHSNHYLAAALALLDEIDLLVQIDTPATRALSDESRRIIEVYSPESSVTRRSPSLSDHELLSYFHGGGEFSDPHALSALRMAIDVVRSNLASARVDQVLIVEL